MANFPVAVNVPQNSVYTVDAAQSIGTSGCATCVGLIVVNQNGIKTCAHFDCTVVNSMAQAATAQQAVNAVLLAHFPAVGAVQAIGICSLVGSTEASTLAILQGIAAVYGAPLLQQVIACDGVVATRAGVIRMLQFNDQIPTLPSPANNLASINAG